MGRRRNKSVSVSTIFRKKSESILVRMIKDAIRRNYFLGVIIKGRQQVGKSRYAFKVMYRIYKDWELVRSHTAFTFWQFFKLLEGEKKKVILWDDAGVHASKYIAWIKKLRPLIHKLHKLADLVGTRTNVLILTTPNLSNLLKPLREYPDWIIVKVVLDAGDWRRAKIYIRDEDVSGKVRYIFKGEDRYHLSQGFPDWFIRSYYKERDRWAKMATEDIKNYVGRLIAQMPDLLV